MPGKSWGPLLNRLMVAAILLMGAVPAGAQSETKCPPGTRTDDVVDDYSGVKVPDPYRWLEDQQAPETRAWIDAQEKCTEAALRNRPGREGIEKQLAALLKVDSFGVPLERNGRYFYMKRRADQDLAVLYTRASKKDAEEILVDPHPLSPDHSTSVTLLEASEDGALVAYGVQAGGADEVTIHFLDTAAKKDLPDVLPRARYFSGIAIRPDKRGAYYTQMTAEGPRTRYHAFGTPLTADEEIFGKGYGPDKIIGAQLSEDSRYLLITVSFGTGSSRVELYIQDLQEKTPVKPLVNDVEAVFRGVVAGGRVFVYTNWNAPHWRVFSVDPARTARDQWREIIPESSATIEGLNRAGGRLVVRYVENAVTRLKVFSAEGKPEGEIPLPALGTASAVSGRWKGNEIFFEFQSFNMPQTILGYDLSRRSVETWARPQVPIDSEAFQIQQVWFNSKDGTRVPMFLFSKKGLERNGKNPTLLTGYGGFDLSVTPYFLPAFAAWVERGGLFASANLRGGSEFGEAWHRAGMLEKKQNVFDDFEAAAQWLISQNYTNSQRLAVIGGSNGGLLVGAALTQKPDLFQAVVCAYPLEDMLRYQKFLVGSFWVPEYGSSDDPEQFKYLYAYSPYQNVKPGTKYPAVLFVTGDSDTRVAPLHARKMAARLQAATASERPILLLYDTKSGHSGGRPVGKVIEEFTDVLSFLFWQLGVNAN